MSHLPDDLIAKTLNSKTRNHDRSHRDDGSIPRLHVSSIIKATPADFFCPREFVLRYMERREGGSGGLPPKFALLFAVGHFYGSYIVQEFLAKNIEYAKYAWGDWTCKCGETHLKRVCLPEGAICNRCTHPVNIYVEIDLFNPDKTVVGHADLIFCVNGFFYIYEFKSIERADIVFDEINEPLGDHIAQASNYYYMLKSEGKKVSKRIRFVYVDRSMSGLYTQKPFREVYANAIPQLRLRKFYRKADLCHSAIRKGKLPERKCESIECSRAKTCTVPVSCFNRAGSKIRRIPMLSDLTHPLLHLDATATPSTMTNGTGSRLKRKTKASRTQPVSSPLRKKS